MCSGTAVTATFDPHRFLDVARTLAVSGADEAALRTDCHQAYYPTFLLAREKLCVTTTAQVHGEVIRVLTRRRKALGDQLFALFRLRQMADYELTTSSGWHSLWLRAHQLASVLIPLLEGIP